MSKKYNKITKEQVLDIFKDNQISNRVMITEKLGCSVYSVRLAVEELIEDKLIKLTNHGYKYIRL